MCSGWWTSTGRLGGALMEPVQVGLVSVSRRSTTQSGGCLFSRKSRWDFMLVNWAILWFELAKVPPGSPVWNIDVLNQRILAQKKVCISITIGPGRQCPLKYMKALMTLDITLSMYQGYNAIITICLICLTCLICRASSSGSQWTMRCWEVVMAIGLPASPKTFPLRLTIISK